MCIYAYMCIHIHIYIYIYIYIYCRALFPVTATVVAVAALRPQLRGEGLLPWSENQLRSELCIC